MAKARAEKQTTPESGHLQALPIKVVNIKIKGTSSLLMNRMSDKAREKLVDTQMGRTVHKEFQKPEEEWMESIYFIDEGRVGFPAQAFKSAMVRAGKTIKLAMTDMRGAFFVKGLPGANDPRSLVEIQGETVNSRIDVGRNQQRGAIGCLRAEIKNWSANLTIEYNSGVVSFDQLINMLNIAGFGTGIGVWRPECNGDYGRFEVERPEAIKEA